MGVPTKTLLFCTVAIFLVCLSQAQDPPEVPDAQGMNYKVVPKFPGLRALGNNIV